MNGCGIYTEFVDGEMVEHICYRARLCEHYHIDSDGYLCEEDGNRFILKAEYE